MYFHERKDLYLDSNFTKVFFPTGLIDNKATLVQEMACRLRGDKQLTEPMLTQFTDAHMQH